MHRLYYLTPSLDSVSSINEDTRAAGLPPGSFHVLAKNKIGLLKKRLEILSFAAETDLIHSGERGATFGFIIGLCFAFTLFMVQPFAIKVGWGIALIATVFFTMLGAWIGGLAGVNQENYRTEKFHDDIKAGKYLVMIDVAEQQEQRVSQMMQSRHPEAKPSGVSDVLTHPWNRI